MNKIKIAIIGAGISGLTLADKLNTQAEITIFEKARGIGGRMSTRYFESFYFDHGAPYFLATTKSFQDFLQPHLESGLVAPWQASVYNLEIGTKATHKSSNQPYLVAVPNMNSLCKKLAQNLTIKLNTEVAALTTKQADGWHLTDTSGNMLGTYDIVISTAPAAQNISLFKDCLANDVRLTNVHMDGCYVLMIGFNTPWQHPWTIAEVHNNLIKLIFINSSKPGRDKENSCIVIHSTAQWTQEYIASDIQDIQDLLCKQFEAITGIDCAAAAYISTHRWRYATAQQAAKPGAYFNTKLNIGWTSDWSSGTHIEDACLQAIELAQKLQALI
jgi:renalase